MMYRFVFVLFLYRCEVGKYLFFYSLVIKFRGKNFDLQLDIGFQIFLLVCLCVCVFVFLTVSIDLE